MQHRARAALAVLSLLGASVLLAPTGAGAAAGTAGAAPGSSWASWQSQALAAVSTYRGGGTLAATGTPGPVSEGTVATPSGPVSITQRTETAAGTGGTVVLQVVILGGEQVVVTEMSPLAGQGGATLVLQPGTSAIANAYAQPSPSAATTSAVHSADGHAARTDAVVRTIGPRPRHRQASLTSGFSCEPLPASPTILDTIYGPLIQGLGHVRCYGYETIDLIVSIYRGFLTRVGTTAAGSSSTDTFMLSAFDYCHAITGTHGFRTSELWGIDGVEQGGATSPGVWLHCT